jgi:hypothetical protein
MKPLKFRKAAFILALIISANISIYAGQDEYSKDIQKEYDVNAQTVLEIENKYGDVDITNWEKNKVVFDIKITVDHRKEEKARELLEYINIEFNQSGNTISAITDIDDKFNKSGWIFDLGGDTKEFSINYKVKMPKNLELELKNKYGDVFIDEIHGRADIAVKYGNLNANKIIRDNTKPLSKVFLGYSDGSTIEETQWLKLELKYSKLEIEKSKALIGVTKYSKLYIDEASSIVCESKYDQYKVGELSNFVGEAKYTDFRFKKVNKKLDLVTKYGDVEVNSVPKGFEKIDIENKYGHIEIEIDEDASYKLEGEAEYADIDYPSGYKISRIEESTDLSVSGIIGNDQNTKSEVIIDTQYGGVELD